ncbi:hypothetical protein BRADI_3g35410v3 [Brachypodium distachyon]|nr:hypothetical protein BRADI_3g35410v3 [Brachypodium distachyon]KQJ98200.1 hypothetical protein BRADI_3g35410v3 [Brachypodium distachyon]
MLYKWILRQDENGLRITVSDVVSHIEHEIEYGGEDPLVSPRSQCTVQSFQASMHIPNTSNQQASPSLLAQAIPGLQPKNSMVFCSALSSPVRQSLQPYHLQQDSGTGHSADGILCTGTHESNSAASNDSFMDMHSDNPAHES